MKTVKHKATQAKQAKAEKSHLALDSWELSFHWHCNTNVVCSVLQLQEHNKPIV